MTFHFIWFNINPMAHTDRRQTQSLFCYFINFSLLLSSIVRAKIIAIFSSSVVRNFIFAISSYRIFSLCCIKYIVKYKISNFEWGEILFNSNPTKLQPFALNEIETFFRFAIIFIIYIFYAISCWIIEMHCLWMMKPNGTV